MLLTMQLLKQMYCVLQACGGSIQTSVGALTDDVLGQCELFEEVQVGGERYGVFFFFLLIQNVIMSMNWRF